MYGGSGIIYANDQEVKDMIAERIAADGVMIDIVNKLSNY